MVRPLIIAREPMIALDEAEAAGTNRAGPGGRVASLWIEEVERKKRAPGREWPALITER